MSQQLVLSIDSTADNFRWCWLSEEGQADMESAASGNLQSLGAAIGNLTQQAWLLVPGAKVVTRELEYSEKEKKHLRNLLPFQLEDAVVGDIDDLHFAIGEAKAGKVTLAYTDKSWLRSIFTQLSGIGLEITRCWAAPHLLPFAERELVVETSEPVEPALDAGTVTDLNASPTQTWVLSLEHETVNIRFAEQQGFSVPMSMVAMALNLLIGTQHLADNLPFIVLRANAKARLNVLKMQLPEALVPRVNSELLVDEWELDYQGKAIDLCQADFSQRLPLERWLKIWRGVGILALVTFAVYLSVIMFHIHNLNTKSLALRKQTEAAFREVVPNGQSDDPEKRLRAKLQSLQPKTMTGSVTTMLAGVLPLVAANPDVTVKVISYTAETGDMMLNVQAHSFNSIESLRTAINGQGFTTEPPVVNVQGDLNVGRLKISKPQH